MLRNMHMDVYLLWKVQLQANIYILKNIYILR